MAESSGAFVAGNPIANLRDMTASGFERTRSASASPTVVIEDSPGPAVAEPALPSTHDAIPTDPNKTEPVAGDGKGEAPAIGDGNGKVQVDQVDLSTLEADLSTALEGVKPAAKTAPTEQVETNAEPAQVQAPVVAEPSGNGGGKTSPPPTPESQWRLPDSGMRFHTAPPALDPARSKSFESIPLGFSPSSRKSTSRSSEKSTATAEKYDRYYYQYLGIHLYMLTKYIYIYIYVQALRVLQGTAKTKDAPLL